MSKRFELRKACLAHGNGQFKQGGKKKKKVHFFLLRERESLACLEGVGVLGGVQIEAKGKPLLALKAWLKR